MIAFRTLPSRIENYSQKQIHFFEDLGVNIDQKTVDSFGEEWLSFDSFSSDEIKVAGDQYFDIVDSHWIENKTCLDVGCGTGRWTKYIAKNAAHVDAVDPSMAVYSAARLLADETNVRITQAGVDTLPFEDNSFDFVFSLGVLHHIPDTAEAMKRCVEKLTSGGYFLVYLYYNFEQRGFIFKCIFGMSALIRGVVSRLPSNIKKFVCDLLAILIYWPLVQLSRFLEFVGMQALSKKIPLSYYKSHSWNIVRNDALDRFGTPLEQRFSREEIIEMMKNAGLIEIVISEKEPYWHAVGKKS